MDELEHEHVDPNRPPLSSTSSSPSCMSDENDDIQPFWRNTTTRKILAKQLSMYEIPRYMAWEKRRRQERMKNVIQHETDVLTDEDLNELKGCIELGFGFNESEGQQLCPTIPALDLYFAVNRQLAYSPVSSPNSSSSTPSHHGLTMNSGPLLTGLGTQSSSFGSPKSDSDSWKICSPGEDPQQIKTKLRHWAQAVACSVMQSS